MLEEILWLDNREGEPIRQHLRYGYRPLGSVGKIRNYSTVTSIFGNELKDPLPFADLDAARSVLIRVVNNLVETAGLVNEGFNNLGKIIYWDDDERKGIYSLRFTPPVLKEEVEVAEVSKVRDIVGIRPTSEFGYIKGMPAKIMEPVGSDYNYFTVSSFMLQEHNVGLDKEFLTLDAAKVFVYDKLQQFRASCFESEILR